MRKIKLLLLVTLLLLSAACLGEEAKSAEMALDTKVAEMTGDLETTEITASEFMDIYVQGEDFVLIDVRTKGEYDSGYISGAIHIPHTEIGERIDELNLPKDAKIVLICEAGVRSKRATNVLLQAGYTNVLDVTDGIRAWKNLGGEIIVPGAEIPADDKSLGVLIAPRDLEKKIDSVKVVFLGTKNQYDTGHIPGAVHIAPLTDLFDPEAAVPHMVLKKADFESLMSSLGVNPEDHLVVYDDMGDRKYAARFFWILKYYGHESVAVLDGGLSSWKGYGGELSTTPPQIQPTDYSVKEVHSELLATLDYVKENLDNPKVKLVEATTKEEFENDGHIPGAVLVEPEETLNPDGTIKDESELLSLYTTRGITRDREVITYCHTGHRGATAWFELKYLLSYPKVRLYDGSLEEWNAMNMPLEKGVPETTSPPQTTPPETTPPPTSWPEPTSQQAPSYLSVEPILTLEGFEGTKTVHMDLWSTIKIDGAYIYLTGDMDGCVGWFWWYFNIYRDTPDGAVWEGTPPMFLNEEVHAPMDISSDIHRVSDALDDYKIVVTRWSEQEGLTVEITH